MKVKVLGKFIIDLTHKLIDTQAEAEALLNAIKKLPCLKGTGIEDAALQSDRDDNSKFVFFLTNKARRGSSQLQLIADVAVAEQKAKVEVDAPIFVEKAAEIIEETVTLADVKHMLLSGESFNGGGVLRVQFPCKSQEEVEAIAAKLISFANATENLSSLASTVKLDQNTSPQGNFQIMLSRTLYENITGVKLDRPGRKHGHHQNDNFTPEYKSQMILLNI